MVAKRKREEDRAKRETLDKGISNYFTKGAVVAQPKSKVRRPTNCDGDILTHQTAS